MAASAAARRAVPAPRRREELEPDAPRPAARRAPQTRARAARRGATMRVFVVFVVCFTALAVGRVALSFAVVQKTLQTDAVARQQRQVSAENARLAEDLAQRSSAVSIRSIAERQLGLVDADHVQYLKVAHRPGSSRGGTRH